MDGQGVKIYDTIENAAALLLQLNPLPDGSEVVTEVESS